MESQGTTLVANAVPSHGHGSGTKVVVLPAPERAQAKFPHYYHEDETADAPYNADLMQQGRFKPRKQGHTCCGCCCDVRRAVIVVNILAGASLLMTVQFIVAVMRDPYSSYNYETPTDDFWADYYEQGSKPHYGAYLVMYCLELVPVGLGLFGAVYYNVYLIGIAALFYTLKCLYYCADLLDANHAFDLSMPIAMAFFAYPHFMLISEIRGGIMSRENYVNEQHSCCCVNSV
jgi:hypothetical protein